MSNPEDQVPEFDDLNSEEMDLFADESLGDLEGDSMTSFDSLDGSFDGSLDGGDDLATFESIDDEPASFDSADDELAAFDSTDEIGEAEPLESLDGPSPFGEEGLSEAEPVDLDEGGKKSKKKKKKKAKKPKQPKVKKEKVKKTKAPGAPRQRPPVETVVLGISLCMFLLATGIFVLELMSYGFQMGP